MSTCQVEKLAEPFENRIKLFVGHDATPTLTWHILTKFLHRGNPLK